MAEGGCSLTEGVSWPLPGATQKTWKPQSGHPGSGPRFEPGTLQIPSISGAWHSIPEHCLKFITYTHRKNVRL